MFVPIFPDDLVTEILSRLPPHYLLRFRCVSKSWRALIDSPAFIRMHLNVSTMNSKANKYIFRVSIGCNYRIYATRLRKRSKTLEEIKDSAIPNFGDMQSSYLVGSCNGLLCLDAYYSIILWNPWIRKSLTIPNPVVQHKLSGYRRSYTRYFFYGFGYDDATDDYKVVRLADHQSPAWCEVKVYSLKKNCWKRLPNFPYRRVLGTFSITCAGILSNCALHWLVEGNNVAAIDLRTEEYRLVPKPEVLGKNYSLTLGVLDGGLCILSKFCPPEYQRSTQLRQLELQLWVMKDYGVKDSWTKLSIQVPNIDQFDNVYLIGHSKGNTELVLQKDGVVNFLWYNFENPKLVEKTIFPAAEGNSSISEGYNCVCSLVQPICGGKKGIKRKSKRKSIKWPQ